MPIPAAARALPIVARLPALLEALDGATAAVLHAPPGAGKTTTVPLALLDAPWRGDSAILVLEPRRLAARAAAHRMAALLGESVGDAVGYRMRLDTRVGPGTRVEVVTEGVLPRLLADDPSLGRYAAVVFDEFHERSLDADVGLALVLHARALLRPDLRVVVMSATLDTARVAAHLGGAPIVASEGRAFPVEVRWRPRRPDEPVERAAARAVRHALAHDPGDVLVFLPGAREIARTAALLADVPDVHRLHGDLPGTAQDAAIAPAPVGRRKVVLSSAIAETSLTIEGVRVVVDAGLARVPRHDARRGMTRLDTVRVTRAAADQRTGRAGRVASGVCYRLWDAAEHPQLLPHRPPEIADADLAPVLLDLIAYGVRDPAELPWLDPPGAPAVAAAREVLRWLGALDDQGRLTAHGRAMAALPAHPRVARMLLRARDHGLAAVACDLAALLGTRDPLRGDPAAGADVRARLDALQRDATLSAIRDDARRWRRLVGAYAADRGDPADAGQVLAWGFPDRVARRRPGEAPRYLLANGVGAALPSPMGLGDAEWLVVADLGGRGPEFRIALAAPVDVGAVEAPIATAEEVAWDAAADRVRARRVERLGAIVLRDAPLADPDPLAVAQALLDAIGGVAGLPWSAPAAALRARLRFLHARHPGDWPSVDDAALQQHAAAWLLPGLTGARTRDAVRRVDLAGALQAWLTPAQRAALDRAAPTHFEAPTGSRLPIDYAGPDAPAVAVRLQELFGLDRHPEVAGVPLTLRLLSPAQRPVQVTRDLRGFWRGSYADVRRELRGRYPRHPWPEDPLAAPPTRRARPRGA